MLVVGFTPARAEAPPWQWPLPPPHQVIAPFDAPEHRYGPGHRGIDIAAPVAGAAVRAVAPGTIRFSGMVAGRGVAQLLTNGQIPTFHHPSFEFLGSGTWALRFTAWAFGALLEGLELRGPNWNISPTFDGDGAAVRG